MAVVAHTPYSGTVDCGRTNEYLVNGHGLAPVDRTNRYISDGHGGQTPCEGYNCPADIQLATKYMEMLRRNYERQHPAKEGRKKGGVTHEQIYVSPTAEDNVPADERMEMTRELIERTALRDFASLYVPHDNKAETHCHISCCPYSIDGTKKLCLNNNLLNDLRREMDRICVEHGYSIIENPELWADKEYREWFFKIKDEGIVKIHPPKDKDMASFKKDRKRARTYSASKAAQAARKLMIDKYYEELSKGVTREEKDRLYTSPLFYDPQQPKQAHVIRRYDKAGKEYSDLALRANDLFTWCTSCSKELRRRKLRGSAGLGKRLLDLAGKAWTAKELLDELDIKTHAELITHIKECGADIAELKQDIARQGTILARMAPVMDAIDRWENSLDKDAYAWLQAHRCGTPEEIADAKKRYARAVGRKARAEDLLPDRKAEYRHLKEAESVIDPASSEELWSEYLESIFTKEIAKRFGFIDREQLTKQAYSMGKVVGFSKPEVDRMVELAARTAQKTTWVEYREFMRVTFIKDGSGAVSAIYDEIRDAYADLRRLRRMERELPYFGPLTFLISLIVGAYLEDKAIAREREIENLRWQVEKQKEYAAEALRERQMHMEAAQQAYNAETYEASAAEISAARIRFYETAARINGRLDIMMEIYRMQDAGALDHQIEQAVAKRLGLEHALPEPEQEHET